MNEPENCTHIPNSLQAKTEFVVILVLTMECIRKFCIVSFDFCSFL